MNAFFCPNLDIAPLSGGSIFQWSQSQILDFRRTNVILLPKHLHHLKITPNVLESIIHTISLAYIDSNFLF